MIWCKQTLQRSSDRLVQAQAKGYITAGHREERDATCRRRDLLSLEVLYAPTIKENRQENTILFQWWRRVVMMIRLPTPSISDCAATGNETEAGKRLCCCQRCKDGGFIVWYCRSKKCQVCHYPAHNCVCGTA